MKMRMSIGTGTMRAMVLLAVAALVLALVASAADAKGREAGKDKGRKAPVVTYVFKGTVASISEGSVTVDVEKGNKFAKVYAGDQVELAVNEATKLRKDDAPVLLSDLSQGDEIVVKARELKGATSFTARMLVAQTPEAEEEPIEPAPTEPAPVESEPVV